LWQVDGLSNDTRLIQQLADGADFPCCIWQRSWSLIPTVSSFSARKRGAIVKTGRKRHTSTEQGRYLLGATQPQAHPAIKGNSQPLASSLSSLETLVT
jgi:hypothetical protein